MPSDPAARSSAPSNRGGPRTGTLAALVVATILAAVWRAPREPDGGGEPDTVPAPESDGPIAMGDLQRLEHLAWLVDNREAEAEAYVEAKLALLNRPTPAELVGPVPNLPLPTDELSALERLRALGHLSDAEYELLERRVLLRL